MMQNRLKTLHDIMMQGMPYPFIYTDPINWINSFDL